MQPGTHSQNFVGAAMHSTGAPNLHVMGAGDQMSAQHDPVVSPHLLQRGAVVAAATRTYQPASQSSYQPNAPLIAFAHQEASQSAEPNEEDQFMNDIFAQNAEDNDSDPLFGAYAPPNHAQYAVQPGEWSSNAMVCRVC